MEALRQSVALPITEQRHATLLNAIYLWACFISRPEDLSQNEDHYIRLSLEAMPDALNTGRYIDAIRASCLLSTYFLSNGRLPEGAYHASAAAALADQLGMGKQGEMDTKSFKTDAYEADRILAFWQVYNLDRCWSVALKKQPVLTDGLSSRKMITAPWPQEISDYKMVRIFVLLRSHELFAYPLFLGSCCEQWTEPDHPGFPRWPDFCEWLLGCGFACQGVYPSISG